MPRFLVQHKADYEKLGSMEKMIQLAAMVRDKAPSDFRWHNVWWDARDEILFCDWDAPDEDSLCKYLRTIEDFWSTQCIYPVLWSDPAWYA